MLDVICHNPDDTNQWNYFHPKIVMMTEHEGSIFLIISWLFRLTLCLTLNPQNPIKLLFRRTDSVIFNNIKIVITLFKSRSYITHLWLLSSRFCDDGFIISTLFNICVCVSDWLAGCQSLTWRELTLVAVAGARASDDRAAGGGQLETSGASVSVTGSGLTELWQGQLAETEEGRHQSVWVTSPAPHSWPGRARGGPATS